MKFSNLFKLSITSLSIAILYSINQPIKVSAFGIGGGNSSVSCEVMKAVEHKDNYMVSFETATGVVELPLLAQFNASCAKTKNLPWAVEHINGTNGKQNIFVLRRVGDVVVYQPDLGEYDNITKKRGSMTHISWDGADSSGVKGRMGNTGWNRHGTSFLNYSVPFNDTSCGYKKKAGETGMEAVCIEGETYYNWGHSLKDNTNTARQTLATAIAKNDMATIERITGEWEYLGYSWDGTVISNPYFPSDYPVRYTSSGKVSQSGSGAPNAYPWYSDPYSWGTAESEFDNLLSTQKNYKIKYDAVSALKTQENMKGSVETLMKQLSMKNDYRYSAAIFEGRGTTYIGDDGKTKRFYNLVMVQSDADSLNNVALMELGIYDGDTKLASWTRKAAMSEFGTAFALKDSSGNFITLEGGKEYTLKMTILNDSAQDLTMAHQVNLEVDASDSTIKDEEHEENLSARGSSAKLSKQKTRTITTKVKIPEVNGYINIDAVLDNAVYGSANHWKIDDSAKIKVNVKTPTGDLSVCGIKLFEKGGETPISQSEIVQDKEYDVEYYICYTGATIGGNHEVNVSGTLSTTGKYHEEISLDRTISIKLDKTNVIRETIRVSNPEIITNIKISTDNERINTDKTNDTGSETFKNAPNIKLTDLTITPGKIEFTPIGCHIVTVSYNLTLTDVKNGYNSTFDTTTRIEIGNEEYSVTDKIKAGTHKHTHNLKYCFPSGDTGGNRNVSAEANKNQAMFESTIKDNFAEITWEGNGGALELNGCPVSDNVSNEVTWNQTYTIDTVEVWMEDGRLMQKVVNTEQKTVENQTESFKITTIQMRSKLQQDLQLGEDGWIDVIEVTEEGTKQIATPKIKAGYGFEFRIKAEYTTNVLSDTDQELDLEKLNKGEKQTIQVVSAGSHDNPNLVNDFYMSIADKKLNVGNGLDLEITDSEENESSKVFNVTITPKVSPNTGHADDTRLYISESTADGLYSYKVFTPAITGLTSRTENSNIILCDEMEIEFEVVGSVYDDLNTHQTR